jgi:hypothetical protein
LFDPCGILEEFEPTYKNVRFQLKLPFPVSLGNSQLPELGPEPLSRVSVLVSTASLGQDEDAHAHTFFCFSPFSSSPAFGGG